MTDWAQDDGFTEATPISISTTNIHKGFAWARAVAFLETVVLSDSWSDQVFTQRFANIVGGACVLEVSLLRSHTPTHALPHPSLCDTALTLTYCIV
jgi:hypothetical protein